MLEQTFSQRGLNCFNISFFFICILYLPVEGSLLDWRLHGFVCGFRSNKKTKGYASCHQHLDNRGRDAW